MSENSRFQTLEAASIEAAKEGIKALLILNGGACVALLSLISNIAASEHVRPDFLVLVPASATSLVLFALGAGLTIVAWIFAYLSNQRYANATLNPLNAAWSWGVNLNRAGLMAVAASLAAFVWGVINLAVAFPS